VHGVRQRLDRARDVREQRIGLRPQVVAAAFDATVPCSRAFSETGAGAKASGTAESLPCRSDWACVRLDATAP
jgi:hypothetical protein